MRPRDTDTFYLLELLSFIGRGREATRERVPRVISRVVIRREFPSSSAVSFLPIYTQLGKLLGTLAFVHAREITGGIPQCLLSVTTGAKP